MTNSKAFIPYYTHLKLIRITQDFEIFFTPLKIPLVHPGMVEITTNELSIAITSMQGGKCPGPDGYPIEFYRKFQHKLAPVLIDTVCTMNHLHLLVYPQHLIKLSFLLSLKRTKTPLPVLPTGRSAC